MHAGSTPPLAELQAAMAHALLAQEPQEQALPAGWFSDQHAGVEGLRVHRNTLLGALSSALRQSFPALDKLVGEAFFDRMAVAFGRAALPAEPQLAAWGAGFPAFASAFPGLASLPYVGELAHFEWLLDELGRALPGELAASPVRALGNGVGLQFAPTLRLLPTRYPVDALREALLADDAARVEQLASQVGEGAQALWRDATGLHSRPLRPQAARCLALLQAGSELQAALDGARGALGDGEFMAIVTADLLQAGFTHITGAPA